MLQIKENQRVTVFEPVVSERLKNTVEASISSSKKIEDDQYMYYSWNAKFVGRAYKDAQKLQSKDRIVLKEAAIENYYNKEKKKLYVSVVIFSFEWANKEA